MSPLNPFFCSYFISNCPDYLVKSPVRKYTATFTHFSTAICNQYNIISIWIFIDTQLVPLLYLWNIVVCYQKKQVIPQNYNLNDVTSVTDNLLEAKYLAEFLKYNTQIWLQSKVIGVLNIFKCVFLVLMRTL
jgi:hypothetical protein